jgi:hypothetical protein
MALDRPEKEGLESYIQRSVEMASYDEPINQPGANKTRAVPSLQTSDDDLVSFAMPTSSSSRQIQTLVPRDPWAALIAGVCLGIVIGKLLR